MRRSWADELSATWIVDRRFVAFLDMWVRAQLERCHRASGRDAAQDTVGAVSVDVLVQDVQRFGAAKDWFWVSMALSLMQELIFCACDGGIKISRNVPSELEHDVEVLRLLRCALMHPAYAADAHGGAKGTPHLFLLLPHFKVDPDFATIARRMEKDRSLLASQEISIFAIRRLNSAVDDYMTAVGVQRPNLVRPGAREPRRG